MTMTQLLVLVVAAAAAMHTTLAAPQPSLQILLDGKINEWLGGLQETISPDHPLELRANQPNVMEVYLQMSQVAITGVNDFASYGSTVEGILNGAQADNASLSIAIQSPKVTLDIGNYFLNGTMVDHIELAGEGPGMISVDDMAVKVHGLGSVRILPSFSVVFTEASIDLEMWRWTVDLEGVMPGTDLGTVFNEFFTMCGPEIFDTVENNLNSSGKLLNFLNSLFPPQ